MFGECVREEASSDIWWAAVVAGGCSSTSGVVEHGGVCGWVCMYGTR